MQTPDQLRETIEALEKELEAERLDTETALEAFRVKYLGRKSGLINPLFGQARQVVSSDDFPRYGQLLNALKERAEARLAEAAAGMTGPQHQPAGDLDLTLPGRTPFLGSLHPITQTLDELKRLFRHFGFSVAEGPEIEDDWHNFTALNFLPDHPARDMQDTFFLEPPPPEGAGVVLRTHTSPVQIRVLQNRRPPVRVIAPGRVYRNESISYKSFCLFHQVEGLYVDEGVTFADLKQLLRVTAQALFGADVQMRFRPSFFPFTEPSAEVDIWNPTKQRWMEILGCGMVDPNVLENVGIDAERYTGYAFGMGVERIAMLRYDVDDIRLFYENDIRFLEQF